MFLIGKNTDKKILKEKRENVRKITNAEKNSNANQRFQIKLRSRMIFMRKMSLKSGEENVGKRRRNNNVVKEIVKEMVREGKRRIIVMRMVMILMDLRVNRIVILLY